MTATTTRYVFLEVFRAGAIRCFTRFLPVTATFSLFAAGRVLRPFFATASFRLGGFIEAWGATGRTVTGAEADASPPVNPWAALASAPATCPNLRATLVSIGSGEIFFFRAVIRSPLSNLLCDVLPSDRIRKKVPASPAGTSPRDCVENLGSAALTVAVLIVFFVFVLPLIALLGLVLVLTGLSGLTSVALLRLTMLTGMRTLLTLSGLIALLGFLVRIVCHENSSLKIAWSSSTPLEFVAIYKN
jgi:hypothetical protein